MQASSGVRLAKKELQHALQQQQLVQQYLYEIGKSWQCATNIAGIFQNLLKEQMPIIERKAANAITSPGSDSLGIPVDNYQEDDDEPVAIPEKASGLTRSLLSRRRSSGKMKQPQGHLVSHSRSTSVSAAQPLSIPVSSTPPQPQPPASPQITISPVQETSRSFSSSSAIMIPRSTRSSSSFSSSPSSFQDPWNLRPSSTNAASPVSHSPLSPSPSDATSFVDNYTQASPSFTQASDYLGPLNFFSTGSSSGIPMEIQHMDPFLYGNDHLGMTGFVNVQPVQPTGMRPSVSYGHPSSGRELHGFPGMLGGNSLSQVPFQYVLAADEPAAPRISPHTQQAPRAPGPFGSLHHSILSTSFPSFASRSSTSSHHINEGMQSVDNNDNTYDDPFMGFEMLTN